MRHLRPKTVSVLKCSATQYSIYLHHRIILLETLSLFFPPVLFSTLHISIHDVTFFSLSLSLSLSLLPLQPPLFRRVVVIYSGPPKVNLSGNRPTSRSYTYRASAVNCQAQPQLQGLDSIHCSSTTNCHHEADATWIRHHHVLPLLALFENYNTLRNSSYFPNFWGWAEFPIKSTRNN